jgi:hypothetical protein
LDREEDEVVADINSSKLAKTIKQFFIFSPGKVVTRQVLKHNASGVTGGETGISRVTAGRLADCSRRIGAALSPRDFLLSVVTGYLCDARLLSRFTRSGEAR